MTLDPELISRAIVVWIGTGKSASPHRDTERLVEAFGTDLAARLHPVVKALADEFFASDANWTIDNKQMTAVTAAELRQRYPGLTDVAADALEKLKNEFFAPDAKWAVADIKQMADGAAEEFREHHPELTEEAIQALKWCYTFDNR